MQRRGEEEASLSDKTNISSDNHVAPNHKMQYHIVAPLQQQKRRRRRRLHLQQQQHPIYTPLCQVIPPSSSFPALSKDVPPEVLGVIESYLSPSDCAYLSATCLSFHRRWSTRRWKKTFQLHYGPHRHRRKSNPNQVIEVEEEGYISYSTWSSKEYKSWEDSFVGCCCDENEYSCSSCLSSPKNNTTMPPWCVPVEATQFNVSALIPSVRRAYTNVWDTIELGFLGYYDTRLYNAAHTLQNQGMMNQSNHAFAMHGIGAPNNDNNTPPPTGVSGQIAVITQALRNALLPHLMEYCFFVVGHRLLVLLGLSTTKTPPSNYLTHNTKLPRYLKRINKTTGQDEYIHPMTTLRSSATSMSAWKLACILKERGVDCLRCGICDQIDLMEDESSSIKGNNGGERWLREFRQQNGGGHVWMTPCHCPELVHRVCLEKKLGLVPKLSAWEWIKGKVRRLKGKIGNGEENKEALAPRVWISYDDNNNNANTSSQANSINTGPAAVDANGCFTSPLAQCPTCHVKYRRSVRLPRSKSEVVISSLSDPVAAMRFVSTHVHFVLCILFLAATEGMQQNNCTDSSCNPKEQIIWTETPLRLILPTTGGYWNGLFLCWWQLWQCCMLHIFFSPRFAAIVDRLWMGPISFFYCRLYLYFLMTSFVLAVSYIPVVNRSILVNVVNMVLGSGGSEEGSGGGVTRWVLGKVWDLLAVVNLVQFMAMSTTVICIFWRTNYRIFTVADSRERDVGSRGGGAMTVGNGDGVGAGIDGGGNVNSNRLEGNGGENDVRMRRVTQHGEGGTVDEAARREGVASVSMMNAGENGENGRGVNYHHSPELAIFPQPERRQTHQQQQELDENFGVGRDANMMMAAPTGDGPGNIGMEMPQGNDTGDVPEVGHDAGVGGGGVEVGLVTRHGGVRSWSTHPIYHGQWQ